MELDELVDSLGRPLPRDLQKDLQIAIVRTIAHPDSDIPAVMRRAQTIARRAIDGEIANVLHYATKALFGVVRKQRRREKLNGVSARPPAAMEELAGSAIDGSPGAIEAQILLEELLGGLDPKEKAVFIRYTMGWRHRKIAEDLGISAAMSSYYLLRAKARLDQLASHSKGRRVGRARYVGQSS